jgi:septum formation protein
VSQEIPQLKMNLVLASSSPRRRELLVEAGYTFLVVPPRDEAEDGQRLGESPEDFVLRMAVQKAGDVVAQLATLSSTEKTLVLGCDTVAVCAGQILGKPTDEADARRMLSLLRGTTHHVLSGVCLWQVEQPQPATTAIDRTTLRMEAITDEQLADYLASGLWQGKAGAFGYQDRTGWLTIESGSESNVVGLPLELLARLLNERASTGERGA